MENTEIRLRQVKADDLPQLIEVERGATPTLSYIPQVFDLFMGDSSGDFSVAEVDGVVTACAKFTVMPDGSAWLETLRVLPQYQGKGIGKRFYEHFFELARRKGITTMRMYTGLENDVSRGLAERFGFYLAFTCGEAYHPCQPDVFPLTDDAFSQVTDVQRGIDLLMPLSEQWGGFMGMNRTFYVLSESLCAHLVRQGQVYEHAGSSSVIALGGRFMPRQALHIGLFGGDTDTCMQFAQQKGIAQGAGRLNCLFPSAAQELRQKLETANFQIAPFELIVMEVVL